jgi:hypothetical protein
VLNQGGLFFSRTWQSFQFLKSKFIEHVTGPHVIIVIDCVPLIDVELFKSLIFVCKFVVIFLLSAFIIIEVERIPINNYLWTSYFSVP